MAVLWSTQCTLILNSLVASLSLQSANFCAAMCTLIDQDDVHYALS